MARLTKAQRALIEADPMLGALIEEIGPLSVAERERRRSVQRPEDAFGALVRAIVGQQLSAKAARAIHARLLAVFDGKTPTPQELAAASEKELCAAGLSGRKATYLRDLAAHVLDGSLELDRLAELGDDVRVDRESRFVDDGDVVTSAGVSAGIDMALHLVALMYGAEIGRATARHMEYPVPESNARRVEAQYIAAAR